MSAADKISRRGTTPTQPLQGKSTNEDHDQQQKAEEKAQPLAFNLALPQDQGVGIGPYIAIALQVCVIIILLVVTLTDVYLRRPGQLSAKDRVLYITSTTALASAISWYTTVQLRTLWVVHVLKTGSESASRRATSMAGFGSFADGFRFWNISLSFFLTGLMTSAITTAITPIPLTVTVPAPTSIHLGEFDFSMREVTPGCFTLTQNATGKLHWKAKNGYLTKANNTATNCPIIQPKKILHDTSTDVNAKGWAYSIDSTLVSVSAIGAPFSTSGDGPLQAFVGSSILLPSESSHQAEAVQWARQCFPVLKSSPVRCKEAGNVSVSDHSVVAEAYGCKVSTPIFSVNPRTEGASTTGVCPDIKEFGRATVVLGSVNSDVSALKMISQDWADFLHWESGTEIEDRTKYRIKDDDDKSFSVGCKIDIESAVEFRSLTLRREDVYNDFERMWYRYSINGTDKCQPSPKAKNLLARVLAPEILALAGSGVADLLSEADYLDGFPRELLRFANIGQNINEPHKQKAQDKPLRFGPAIFENARSHLEEKLGLALAITLGAQWGTDRGEDQFEIGHPVKGEELDPHDEDRTIKRHESIQLEGVVAMPGIRVGPDHKWALAFLIPEVYAVMLLVYLILRRRMATSA